MIGNLLLILCLLAAAGGWFLRRSDPGKSPTLVAAPVAIAIVIIFFQLIAGFFSSPRESSIDRAHKAYVNRLQFEYAAGWKLVALAAQQNPGAEALIIVRDDAPKRAESEMGRWLAGAQDSAKKAGLKATVATVTATDITPAAMAVVGSVEISTDVLTRIHQADPAKKVWISFYLPQTTTLPGATFLGPGQVRYYCFGQFAASHSVNPRWWTEMFQAGRLQAVALERFGYFEQNNRPLPVGEVEADFTTAYVLLTPEKPQLPPELITQLPEKLRN